MKMLIANTFKDHQEAVEAYELVIEKYDALRLPWAFPKWLMMDAAILEKTDLEYQGELHKAGLLTIDGMKRYRKALKRSEEQGGGAGQAQPGHQDRDWPRIGQAQPGHRDRPSEQG